MTDRTSRTTALYSTVATIVMIVFSPLLALSYFATSEGAEELAAGTVAAWARPASDALAPLLTFAGPDRVYATYLQITALVFPALVVTALVARRRRPQAMRAGERWVWRVAIAGYGLTAFGVALIAVALIPTAPSSAVVDAAFMAGLVPGMLLSLIGSTMLGIALIRTHHEPRLTGWLLAFAIPLGLGGSVLLGHNSLGLIPLFIAWTVTAWRWVVRDMADPIAGVGVAAGGQRSGEGVAV